MSANIDKNKDCISCKNENMGGTIPVKEGDIIRCKNIPETMSAKITFHNKFSYGIECIICGETVKLTDNEEEMLRHNMHIHSKVCDKCKRAVLHIRKNLERDPCEPILD